MAILFDGNGKFLFLTAECMSLANCQEMVLLDWISKMSCRYTFVGIGKIIIYNLRRVSEGMPQVRLLVRFWLKRCSITSEFWRNCS